MEDLIVTIHAKPTESGKYMWIVEEQFTTAENGFPDWRLVANGFAESPFEAYKLAMFEVNKGRDEE